MNDTAQPRKFLGRDIVAPAATASERVTFVVWGSPGCGKSVLAGTLPKRIFWIGFDPDGEKVVSGVDGIDFVGFANMTPTAMRETFTEGGTFERALGDQLKSNPDIQSVVVDSITSYAQLALTYAVDKAPGVGVNKPNIEQPGIAGYGIRNRNVLGFTRMLLRVTGQYNRHCMLICHEDAPEKKPDDKGVLQLERITLLLGGSLPIEVPVHISEVWYMKDHGSRRTLHMRPYSVITPMKSRMFRTHPNTSCEWNYDMYNRKGSTVEQWINQWRAGGPGYKLPL